MLSDEDDPIVRVQGDDADREVLEVHDAVDPGAAVGSIDLVVPDGDPRVLVGGAAHLAHELTVHRRIVARPGPGRRVRIQRS